MRNEFYKIAVQGRTLPGRPAFYGCQFRFADHLRIPNQIVHNRFLQLKSEQEVKKNFELILLPPFSLIDSSQALGRSVRKFSTLAPLDLS